MKTAKRVVPCLLGTITLTSFILFAINAYHANQSVSQLTAAEEPETAAPEKLSSSAEELSINFSERDMLYQPQEPAGAPADSGQTGQTGINAGSSASQPAETDGQTGNDPIQNDGQDGDSIVKNSGQDGNDSGNNIGQAGHDSSNNIGQAGHDSSNNSARTAAGDSNNAQTETGSSKNSAQDGDRTAQTGKQSDSSQTEQKATSGKNKKKSKQKKNSSGKDQRNTFQTVSEDYFSDAVFIGDSRTVGLQQSGLLPDAAFYAKTGIGIGEILSKRIVNEGGYMISVKEALSRHSFGKVYIMIGINDMSMGDTDWYKEQYQEILDTVRQTQPDAVIYIQGNIPMSYNTQDLDGALNNKNLSLRDEAACTLADSETIFYLDVNTLYADANGHLASMYTTDGLHIKPNYYPLWADYLKHRAIVH